MKTPATPPMLPEAIALAPPVKTGGVAVAEPVIEGVGMPLQPEGDPECDPIPQDMVGEGIAPDDMDIPPLPPPQPPKPPPSFIFGPTCKADKIRTHPNK